MTDQPGWIRLAEGRDGAVLQAGGAWTVQYAAELDRQVGSLSAEAAPRALELGEIEAIDSAGAWLLARATGQGEPREIPWRNGQFDPEALSHRLATQARAHHAHREWRARSQQRTLAFCVSRTHADFMAAH